MLIYKDLRDRVADGEGWSDSHMEWSKVYLSITQDVSNKKLGGNHIRVIDRYR